MVVTTCNYVLADWNQSDMHLTSGVVGVVRVRRSFKSGVLERVMEKHMTAQEAEGQCNVLHKDLRRGSLSHRQTLDN